MAKTYLAVVEGAWPDDSGEWEDWLLKDERTNVVAAVPPGTPGAQRANVAYRVVDRRAGTLTIELRPTTGRGHQLRVQLASRGLPIVGDRKYGARSTLDGPRRPAPDRAPCPGAAVQASDPAGASSDRRADPGRLAILRRFERTPLRADLLQ